MYKSTITVVLFTKNLTEPQKLELCSEVISALIKPKNCFVRISKNQKVNDDYIDKFIDKKLWWIK